MIRRLLSFFGFSLALALASPACAGEAAEFDVALANAFAHCRDALYQSAPGRVDAAATREALAAFETAWRGVIGRYSSQPPPHYSEDTDFAQELTNIADVAHQATQRAERRQIAQSRALLQQVPALLADMRHRNGLENYTDQIETFGEALAEITDDVFERPELSPGQVVGLLKQVGALSYLGERMEKRAPVRLAEDEAFLKLVEAINAQLRALETAVLAGQRSPVEAVLKDLREAYDRLYLMYG